MMNQIPTVPVNSYPVKKYSPLIILQYTVLIAVLLYFGKALFIPLSFALLISCVLYPVCSLLEKKGMNKALSITIAVSSLIILTGAIVFLLVMQFASFANESHELKIKLSDALNELTTWLAANFNITINQQRLWLKNLSDNWGAQAIPLIGATLNSLSVSAVLMFLTPVMSSLILYNRRQFLAVLYSLFSADKKETIHGILHDVIHTYYSFIKGMLIVYLIVGTLNSIGLAIIGLPHPVLFGFIASVLTFIPYVGIIAGALLPVSISWIEYNSIWYPLGVIFIFAFVQFLEANIIFPLAVSHRLKTNTLVTLIAIIAGGILWGTAGMILFVPYLGILKLIADKAESLKPLSVFIGTKDGS